MESEQEPCCHTAAKTIARELGVRIDHPGTVLLARALAGTAEELVSDPVVISRKGDRSRPDTDEPPLALTTEHPGEPAERTRRHAETRRTG